MRNIFIILLTFLYVNGYSQVKDALKSGNYPSNPQWNGNITEWFINADQKLQTQKSTIAKKVYVTTANALAVNTKWSFYVQMDFDPSSSNQFLIYLISDNVDLTQPLNGYFLQIGKSGSSDSFDLFKQTGTKTTQLLTGIARPRAKASQFKAYVEVTRSFSGKWEIKSKIDNETNFVIDGTINDNTFTTTAYVGVAAKYTATRSNQFYFADLLIEPYENIQPPPPIYKGNPGDLIFTELFLNPSHQIDLPTSEFVELHNTTDRILNLKGWNYSDATTSYTFKDLTIQPKEYAIVCASADTANYKVYGKTIGISPWPSLNNSGDHLTLKNADGIIIDQVDYTDLWYKDAHKKTGGYTLELIENMQYCSVAQRWLGSMAIEGGTPGKRNSVSDLPKPVLGVTMINTVNNETIDVYLSTGIDSASLSKNTVSIQPFTAIRSVQLKNNTFDQLTITLEKPLASGQKYQLQLNDIKDCFGTVINYNSSEFFVPEKIHPGSLLINEVLFNPKTNGVDFVEIINNSSSIVDLKDLQLGGRTSKDSLVFYPIISSSFLIVPGEIKAITTNPDVVKEHYFCKDPDAFIKVKSMPSYNNDAGTVLLKSGGSIIDRLDYTEKMHFALIKNVKGVSLERVNLDKPTNAPGNFHSASSTVGYATPGYENSQFQLTTSSDDEVTLSSSIISPDNDGMDDLISLNFNLKENGYLATISIFDRNGKPIRQLANNVLIGPNSSITWDGLTDQSQPAGIGPHILFIRLFSTSGTVKQYKKTVIVAEKLN